MSNEAKRVLYTMLPYLSALLAMFSLGGGVLSEAVEWRTYALSPLGLLTLIALGYLAFKCLTRSTRRSLLIALPFSACYAAALVLGANVINGGGANLSDLGTYFTIVALIPYGVIVFSGALSYFGKIASSESKESRLWLLVFRGKRRFLLFWAIIFVSWLPIFLATWPGIWQFDTIYQTQYLLTGDSISAHHPVVHTLWLSVPMQVSYSLFGNYTPGYAFYTTTQVLALSALFAYILLIVSKWNVPNIVPSLTLLAFCVFPGFSMWSVVATKDVIFSGLFGLCVVLLFDLLAMTERGERPSKIQWVCLGVSLFVMFLFRNNGVYGFILFAIIIVVATRKFRKEIFAVSLSVVLAYGLLTGPLYGVFDIEAGGKQELMSVPAVQLARTMLNAKGLTDEQKEFIQNYVPDWEKYDDSLADPVKGSFQVEKVLEDPLDFVQGYTQLGLKYPGIYSSAFLRLSVGFWNPMDDYTFGEEQQGMAPFILGNRKPSELRPANEYIYMDTESFLPHSAYEALDKARISYPELSVPGFASLFQTGTWVWLIAFYIVTCVYLRKRIYLIPALFFFTYWLTLLLGPVSIYRYTMVVFVCVPIFISVLTSFKYEGGLKPKGNS